jgi:hypothetical protein
VWVDAEARSGSTSAIERKEQTSMDINAASALGFLTPEPSDSFINHFDPFNDNLKYTGPASYVDPFLDIFQS